MKKTPIITAGAVAAFVLGGSSSAYALAHEVDLQVYGKHSTVRMLTGTVEDALIGQGVHIKPTDAVSPALDTPLDQADTITVIKRYPVRIAVDGAETSSLVTATTVGDALAPLGLPADAQISPAPSTKLTDKTTTITVRTMRSITFTGQEGQVALEVPSGTVAEAATAHLADVDLASDRFYDAANAPLDPATPVQDGMAVRIERVRTTEATSPTEIPFTTKTTDDPAKDKGAESVVTEGVPGSKDVTTRTVTVDGAVTESSVVAENVTKQPVQKVVARGTKAKAAPAPAPAASTASGTSSDTSAAASPSASAPAQGGAPTGDATTCRASYYGGGDGTDGGPTASGERFNASAMTAAHKTLPLGTRIRVTNTSNGKSVVVRINDRGPYVGGRCLDLSAGAFGAIGSTSSGTMTVSFQRVG